MLTKKDYCDYDTCVALKKLGYNEKTLAYYISEGFFHWIRAYIYNVAIPDLANSSNKKPYKHIIDAMSLYEAQKWLREEKDTHIVVNPTNGKYYCTILLKDKNPILLAHEGIVVKYFVCYEDALLEGIKEAINILKEKSNGN